MSIITQRGNLAEIVAGQLSERIDTGRYSPGGKMPSSAQLCEEFGVSRTVIREALASLKVGGRITTRQGAGAFVAEHETRPLRFEMPPIDDVRSAMQILELRLGVEIEAVALAAARRTPEALAEIARAYDRMTTLPSEDAEEAAKADFEFHLAIARATRNPHFPRFLVAVLGDINFDLVFKRRRLQDGRAYFRKVNREHAAILSAITQGDARAARTAMELHLREGLSRYRRMLVDQA